MFAEQTLSIAPVQQILWMSKALANASGKNFSRCCTFSVLSLACATMSPQAVRAQTSRTPAIVQVCAPCHGTDGTGGDVEKPNLAGQKSIYIRQQLMAFRTGKRKHPDMKTIARELTDREIDQLVVYYSTLVPR